MLGKRRSFGAYGRPGKAFAGGMRDALASPVFVLAASYVGFGALVRSSEFSLGAALFSSAFGFALPGQIVAIELMALGASLLSIAAAVALTNLRLFPMTVALMPHISTPGTPRWKYYAASHFVAVTAWLAGMSRCPTLPSEERLAYFVGFGASVWGAMQLFTLIGYTAVSGMPPSLALGLVFLMPLYFIMMLSADFRQRAKAISMVLGAACGPPLHLVSPEWGLLLTGVIAGGAAFAIDRALLRRAGEAAGD